MSMKEIKNEDIIDLSCSDKESEFVNYGLSLETEVATDVAEVLVDFPYIGSVIKLGKVYGKYNEYRFVKKLARFLKNDLDIPEEEKNAFLDSLTSEHRKQIHDYIVTYLLRAEDDRKADIMGFLYKECVLGKIDLMTFLRLSSIVDRVFLEDLKQLPLYYQKEVEDISIEANNFIGLGLIDNYVGGIWTDAPTCTLNEVGEQLYEILNKYNWFQS